MSRKINQFSHGGFIEFDNGSFDNWCVFVTRANGERFAPSDVQYFSRLNILGKKYGCRVIYDDFVTVYNRTGPQINNDVLNLITTLSRFYGTDMLEMEIWFNVLYAGMIAEENKENAVLKKRIKRLGMHQVLIEKMEPEIAAAFSKGKKWRELDRLMKQKGF
ncbi:hypothetical protein D1164_21275 [Mariniphaga sediminis]|uniref:Uncharacterized protein n=1 Tax=Mariniphaga sediminis TaxID=1628158 RepID=A0A399CVX4_9BACT|nr:hypothetical protein [Mariniphaga sediminis]RIH63138.1 hypothetical protein D1164_21275 [Mariniphaga sediminis]